MKTYGKKLPSYLPEGGKKLYDAIPKHKLWDAIVEHITQQHPGPLTHEQCLQNIRAFCFPQAPPQITGLAPNTTAEVPQ